jgi:NurA-like 5'-3' nuclease
LIEKWPKRGAENAQDFWKRMMKELRQLSKGMRANLDGEMKRKKSSLLLKMERLDKKADQQSIEGEEWKLRYKLERDLEEVLNYEENI